MPQVKPDVEAFARIKVFGIGGSGNNAVNHMVNSKVQGVDFVAINTDAQDLHQTKAKKKIHIGKNLTRGLGTGMNPDLGKQAVEENKEEIQEVIKGADMIFIACGMGGGTGTGASPLIAKTAKELGVLTVAVVTKPFSFEGAQRKSYAEDGIKDLQSMVDAIITVPNDQLFQTISKETTAKNAFALCDDILKQAVEGISDLITNPGIINTDFADIRAVMENAGTALMGIGRNSGKNRATEAAQKAINSPLLELSIEGAQGVLFSIAGGDDMTMYEIKEAADTITNSVDQNAKIIFGTVKDEKLKKGELKITVIASGFSEEALRRHRQAAQRQTSGSETEDKQITAEDKTEKREIHHKLPPKQESKNSLSEEQPRQEQPLKAQEDQENSDDDDDDDWGSVPSFLRRSKLK